MRTLLQSVGRSLLRLMEQSEDALSVWDDALADDAAFTGDLSSARRRA